MKRSLFVLLALAALLIGCEPETYLFVDEKPLSFSEEGGSATIDLVANKDWSASSNNGWCSVTPSSGAGDVGGMRLTVKCNKNDGYDDRSSTVTIRCAELTKSVQVSQSKKKTLALSQTEFTVGDKGGTISVSVQSNVSYTCTIVEGSSWITAISAKGLSTDTRQFSVKENTTYDARVGRIRFADSGSGLSEDVVVRQAYKGAIVITKKEYNIGSEGGTISVELQSNVNYQYQILAGSTWISAVNTKSLTTSYKQFSIKENTSYDSREGQIRFYDSNSGSSETIVVKQSAKGVVKIDKTQYNLTYEEQVLEISLLENTDYEVKIATDSQGWIKKVDTKGLNTSSFSLSIEENEQSAREGVVYVTFASDIITLKIKQADGTITIPDANFRKYCIDNFDKNGDGAISYKEARSVSRIDVITDDIESLQGIEHFIDLQTLYCCGSGRNNSSQSYVYGKLSSLDLSKNVALNEIYCYYNQLKTLKLSNNIHLTSLYCYCNQLTSLDVSKNTGLNYLQCEQNHLTILDVSNNTSLTYLYCANNPLASLDVSKNMALRYLYCHNNQLTSLIVVNNTALRSLGCSSNQLTTLDVSKNTALIWLSCHYNQLATLDVSKLEGLKTLHCHGNGITTLDVSKNTALTSLYCAGNPLTTLDISNNTALVELWCSSNQLSSLNVSTNTALTELQCHSNQLTSLDVTRNTALTDLSCSSNQLTSLDVSRNTSLQTLSCSANQLTSLDVSSNTALTSLYCGYNQLTSLDVSRNTMLETLSCYNTTMTDLYLAQGQTFKDSNWYSGTRVHYGAGLENGYEWVDLGLPSGLKWATCNVGASSPSDYGSYFAWGETNTKGTYDWTNYKFRVSGDNWNNVTFNKYNTQSAYGTVDNKTRLERSDDAARQNWGGRWRMPTDAEWTELRERCGWTWMTQEGKNGYKVTSKTNGNSIFLSAAGLRAGSSLLEADSFGGYWSSSLSSNSPIFGWSLHFSSGGVFDLYYRYYGFSVRPVTE